MTLAEMYMTGMVKEATPIASSATAAAAKAAKAAEKAAGGAKKPGFFSDLKTQGSDVLDALKGNHAGANKWRTRAELAGGALAVGGGALALRKLMAKKSLGARLGGAFKKNRKAIAIGAGTGAAGLAGLAAYKKSQNK